MKPLIVQISGEPTRFTVEGVTLYCSRRNLDKSRGCRYVCRPSRVRRLMKHKPGDRCPRCGEGVLRPMTSLVNVADYPLADGSFNGSCSCEWFDFNIRPVLDRSASTLTEPIRCGHIEAVRDFALDLTLAQHLKKS